jgi:acyl-CoA synthetase (AMP-forming)/AMP-acid ligase II
MSLSLGALAEASLERLGDHRSLEFEGTWHTAGDLHARAVRLAAGFAALGVRPGDRVVVCMTNCPEVLLSYAALWRAGAVPTPVISAVTPTELRHVLVDSGAVVAVASQASLPLVSDAAQGLDVHVVVDLAELEGHGDGPLADRAEDDLAALLYTGGTTGRSKGVMLTHTGLSQISRSRAQVFSESGATDLLLALPLSHVYGLLNSVTRMHMPAAGFVALQRKFDAAQWLDMASRLRPQAAALVPSMLQLLLRQDLESADLSSLYYVTTGGAPLVGGGTRGVRAPGRRGASLRRLRVHGGHLDRDDEPVHGAALRQRRPAAAGGRGEGRRRAGRGGADRQRRGGVRAVGGRDGRLLDRRPPRRAGDGCGGAGRLDAHRRRGARRLRRLPLRRRPHQGPHHPRRLQRLPP